MAMGIKYLADTRGDDEQGSVGFSMESSGGRATYLVESPTAAQLNYIPTDLLGGVNLKPRNYGSITGGEVPYGGIKRMLPKRHPLFENLFVNGINDIRGTGGEDRQYTLTDATADAFVPAIKQYAKYGNYWVQVSYSNRNYDIKPDSYISTKQDKFFDTDGSEKSFIYPEEWLRYFGTPKQTFLGDFASAQQGQMNFRTESGSRPQSVPFQDAPRMLLPDSIVTFDWYQVPYSYWISPDSYLRRCIGMLNQTEWKGYAAGTLLYLGADVQDYTPPVQVTRGKLFGVSLGVDQFRLCNLTLKFKLTTRIGTDTPEYGGAKAPNKNWIVAGHNLLPWLTTRRYYYATSFDPDAPSDANKWVPVYRSFPVPLLFADPSYPQPDSFVLQP